MMRRSMVLMAALLASHAFAADPKKSDEALNDQLEAAQERLDEAAREVAELSMTMSEHAVPMIREFHAGIQRRAILGINIGAGSDDAEGVKIISVSPGGPASRAGLQAGDVLTRIDDVILKRDDERSARAKLLRHLRDVEPGTQVKLEYLRGKQKKTVEVDTEAPQFNVLAPLPPGAPLPPAVDMFFRAGGAFRAAELVPLTPQLGRYFGTEEGLLVVRAPRDKALQLEDGDVLLDIDGRKPSSPSHAMRILGSYQNGEKVKLNVLRMKKRVTLEVAVPEASENEAHGIRHRRVELRDAPGPQTAPAPAPPEPPL